MNDSWVDSHCHLQLAPESPDVLLDRASQVEWVVVPGVDAATSEMALDLAHRFGNRILPCVGIHPAYADGWREHQDTITELAPRAAAIGETGLDFFRSSSPRDIQVAALRFHLELAIAVDKPVVVHCRDAFREVYQIIKETGTGDRAIMHCWTGGPHWTRRFLDLGVTFSFANPVVFAIDDMLRRGAALVPPTRAMVESDTPHLCPIPGSRGGNEPARVVIVGAALAAVWQLTTHEVALVTSDTARRTFRRTDS